MFEGPGSTAQIPGNILSLQLIIVVVGTRSHRDHHSLYLFPFLLLLTVMEMALNSQPTPEV